MRIAFMGTPDFAVPTLDALLEAGHEVVAVYTQPPRPAGRGKAPAPPPSSGAPKPPGSRCARPLSLQGEAEQAAFAALDLDVAVVAAYGLILPEPILDAPRQGCLNVHASLLPRWRGAAPIQRAILAGDARTGITIMQMEKGLDTGPMLAALADRDRPQDRGRADRGAGRDRRRADGRACSKSSANTGRMPQNEARATYAPKIEKEEAKLDFAQPADQVERQIRAFNPAPGAWFEHDGERIKVLAAELSEASGEPGTVLDHGLAIACGEGSIVPTLVQRAGRARDDAGGAAARLRHSGGRQARHDPLPPHHRI